LPTNAVNGSWNGQDYLSIPLGQNEIRCLPTPGHTCESVSYVYLKEGIPRLAFTGDLLLTGSLGRTNFQNSCAFSMAQSLKTLDALLSESCCLCPAHDYVQSFATTWGAEKLTNKHLLKALQCSAEDFKNAKFLLDANLLSTDESGQLMCGAIENSVANSNPENVIGSKLLAEFQSNSKHKVRILDVREPWESSAFQDWPSLGFQQAPENVPLSRFVNLVMQLLEIPVSERHPLVLICRSGGRAFAMAQSLRRLGYDNAWSLEGGVAFGLNQSHSQDDQIEAYDTEYCI
jgi:cysteine desulfurase